uniref:Uncharacterized protein n=1 Tax=Parietochloris pseudoalveolaris TaxID=3102 RepID=A0A097KLL5_9CHLO|nr:hypothetical protein [Parietochloris pseudoalveolaris]AIT94076.1 hypothetical protein [Parietochloris pseudoalveolaris]
MKTKAIPFGDPGLHKPVKTWGYTNFVCVFVCVPKGIILTLASSTRAEVNILSTIKVFAKLAETKVFEKVSQFWLQIKQAC